MSSTRRRQHVQRHLLSDVQWGMQYGLGVTAIALVPAVCVAVIQTVAGDRVEWRKVVEVVTGYLIFGACGGAIAGLARPTLSKLWGAVLIGALIGALGVTALIFFGVDGAMQNARLLAFSAVIGAVAGAVAGASKHFRQKQRQEQEAVASRLR